MVPSWRLVSLLLAALLFAAPSSGLHHRVGIAAGGDVVLAPGVGGNGFALLRWELFGLPRRGRFMLDFNSDTLRLQLDGRFGRIETGVQAAGEVFIAGLLTSHYRDGKNDPSRGFYASYAALAAWAKLHARPHYLELAAGGRRWFFSATDSTRADLTLPPEAWVGEIRLRYTLWRIDPDPSLWEAHRLHARVRGFAFGVEVGIDARSHASRWGAPDDPRNDPSQQTVMIKQWARAGIDLGRRVRLQLDEFACFMWGEDDLNRVRVGGMNPYSVPLAGAPWAGYLAGKLASLHASLHIRVKDRHELGLILDGVALEDSDRLGPLGRPGLLAGIGLFADLRIKTWQLDLRTGYSPTLPHGFGVFLSAGTTLLR
jgi:hypothetical protein